MGSHNHMIRLSPKRQTPKLHPLFQHQLNWVPLRVAVTPNHISTTALSCYFNITTLKHSGVGWLTLIPSHICGPSQLKSCAYCAYMITVSLQMHDYCFSLSLWKATHTRRVFWSIRYRFYCQRVKVYNQNQYILCYVQIESNFKPSSPNSRLTTWTERTSTLLEKRAINRTLYKHISL